MLRRPAALFLTSLAGLAAAGCGEESAVGDGAATPTAAVERTAETTTAPPPTATARARTAASRSTIATGLQVPWGVAFLPNGDALVAERTTGRIVRIAKGSKTKRTAMTVSGVATDRGEGGLLGLAVSPDYAKDKLVYAYFTTSRDNRIVRFKLGGKLDPIVTGITANVIHNGGRIAFGPDRKLYASVGDAANTGNAQNPESRNGKILRMNADGSAPSDNPFKGSLVYSLGHRNPQGLAWDKAGRLWAVEFGQNEYDEVNLIQAGKNYGWPTVEGRGSTQGGKFVNPKVIWPTNEASPSGAAIRGSTLWVAGLGGQKLFRIPLDGATAGKPVASLSGTYGRLRTVVNAPDGSLWITTSNRDGRGNPGSGDDKVIRLRP